MKQGEHSGGRGAGAALEQGRDAYARQAWSEAYERLASADTSAPLRGADLELLAWAAALTGRDTEFLETLERLYNAQIEAGYCVDAARSAFWLGFRLFGIGETGRAGGWMARAQRLVDREATECVVRGYLLVSAVFERLFAGDLEAAARAAADATEIGERFGDKDLVGLAGSLQGTVLLRQERIADGLALLDEAMVAATSGELSAIVTGIVYCNQISACQKVYAFDRAREWTTALTKWCEARPQLVTFTGSCLVHRSEILQLGGEWGEAIDEARHVCERLSQSEERGVLAAAFYQQAEIHRLRGEIDAAEEAYRSASQLGRDPQPGLALLRLAQGRHEAAASALRRVLCATTDRLKRTSLLPAHIEIMLATQDLEAARASCIELEQIAAAVDIDVVGAMAAHARGAILLAEGDAQAALAPLHRAFSTWQKLGAPYIAARLRVLIGRACHALGDEDGRSLELGAARTVFEQLGARPDLAQIDTPKTGRASRTRHGLTARELEVLRLVAAGKTNKAIAKELYLSEKTIDRHLSNIFAKTSLKSRAAATAYAYQHQLI